jgi:hypothetical protein
MRVSRGVKLNVHREGERPRKPYFPQMFGLARTLAPPRIIGIYTYQGDFVP